MPAIGFLVYSVIAILGSILDLNELNIVGAGLMFLCILVPDYRAVLSVGTDISIKLVVFILFIPILAVLYDSTCTLFIEFLKHYAVYLVYVLIFSLRLCPIYSTPLRKVFIFSLLLIAAVSIIIPSSSEVYGVVRVSGVFVNANNLVLVILALLFLINEDKDSRSVKILFHVVIIMFLLLSVTSGAFVCYVGAMLFKYIVFLRSVHKHKVRLFLVLLSIFIVFLVCLLPKSLYKNVPIVNKVISQFFMIKEELPIAVYGYELDYGQLSRMHGEESLSGIWRISHWRKGFDLIAGANIFQLLLGHGIGSSSLIFDKVPHNDYLKIAIEQGIFGLFATLAFFVILFRRIDWKYRHCIVAVALYCFSENIINNLLFMSIFIFFAASTQNRVPFAPGHVNTMK